MTEVQVVEESKNELSGFTNSNSPAQVSHNTEVESTRAAQQVQVAMTVAQKFPRQEATAYTRIINACKRPLLAENAIFQFPRGGKKVKGPTIKLAKEVAKNWGNLDYGIKELEKKEDETIVEAYCWDMETNVRETKVFTVPHNIQTKQGMKTLTDPRDIYEIAANWGARRLRECIFGIIPIDVKEAAIAACYKTMATGGKDRPLSDRVREMVAYFTGIGVDQKTLEKYLGHEISSIDETELVDLRMIANSLKNGEVKRDAYFDLGTSNGGHAAALNDEFKNKKSKETDKTDKTKTDDPKADPFAKPKGNKKEPKI